MAPHFLLLLLFFFFFFFFFFFLITSSFSHKPSFQKSLFLPVTKHPSTLLYSSRLCRGTPPVPVNLVVDLGLPFLWLNCASRSSSSSLQSIGSRSLHCSRAKTTGRGRETGDTCTLDAVNTVTLVAAVAGLAEDTVGAVDRFLFSCAPPLLLTGLPTGVEGMLGFGRSRISLPSQVAAAFGVHRRFSVCLSSSNGVIIDGDRPGNMWNSLTYTPLISNQAGKTEDYYINLKSIKINDKRLSLNATKLSNGGTKLSTVVPYTTMETTVYGGFTEAYVRAAAAMNMTRVAVVAPFGVCFGSGGIERTPTGPAVPAIDLVLQSEMVKWRIHGGNSMVEVGDGVMCLGVVDGGLNPTATIVIGGFQLEDNFLEFDLGTSMLGFSSSLLTKGTSCSEFRLKSMSGTESL